MRTSVILLTLLVMPSVAFAHSGTVFKAVMNYLPMLAVSIPLFIKPITKAVRNCYARLKVKMFKR
ncbi:MAG TPA: hypothetical protein IAB06_05325 [Candidatus Avacidaminococcus intestinavium]|uniref:Uncharacterized protein n=1 Tax=Candidatus Avacidaminococcus intestinavium TaxID=2840684 RepID=A0A9D1MPV0_9FIRM|nr:hypothetical protein [Candidatus Avacidaminococcus intestinavium]